MVEDPQRRHGPGSPGQPAERSYAPPDTAALVDELEQRVITEREAEQRPGNATERAEVTPVEPDQQAPV
jgi:hypothetical protein